MNEHELAALRAEGTNLERQAHSVLERGLQAVTVTLGAQGSVTVTPAAPTACPPTPCSPWTPRAPGTPSAACSPRDSRRATRCPALRAAGIAAALACTRPGAQDAMPDWAEVQAILTPPDRSAAG